MPTLTLLDEAMFRGGRMVPAIHRLGGGTIAMAGAQQPWRVVGSESVVYQLRQANGHVVALRCPLADTPDPALAERYRALGADPALKRLRAEPSFPLVGGISYIADGLTLPGAELRSVHHPIVAMDWVMGPTLSAATDRACRANDGPYLRALAEAWRAAALMLHEARFVHGNLTGDNAMVRPREGIAVVDYDTAWWSGAPSIPQLDPRPAYRHPRGVPTDPAQRDAFATLVIYTSLRVLAEWPDLRHEHGDPPSQLGGALLFSPKDLSNPDGSALFGKIRVIDEPAVQALAAQLREACRAKPAATPFLAEVIAAATAVARVAPPPKPVRGSLEAKERHQRIGRLNAMLLAGRDDEARSYWRTSGLSQDADAAKVLGPKMAELERRRKVRESKPPIPTPTAEDLLRGPSPESASTWPVHVARPAIEPKRIPVEIEQLRIALEAGDAAAVAAMWPIVQSMPESSVFAARAHEQITRLHAESTAAAIERGDDQAIVAAVTNAERSGHAIGFDARRALRAASARLLAREELTTALEIDDRAALEALALSGDLDEMGEFEPAVTSQILRALATPHLLRAVESGDDTAIVTAYNPEVFDTDVGLPPEVRARIDLARSRESWLVSVRTALANRDAITLRNAIEVVDELAWGRLSRVERTRIERLLARDDAINALDVALESGQDNAIVDALGQAEAVGATLPADLDWAAIRGVIDRLSLVTSIRRAALASPPDHQRLARLLPQARAESNGEPAYLGHDLDFEQLEDDVRRASQRGRLREAIAHGDARAIVAAAVPDLYGTVATLSDGERAIVERAVKAHQTNAALHPAGHSR